MKCNRVVASDRSGKKKMVKACSGGKEKLIHFGAKGYGHNYSAGQENHSGQDTNVQQQRTNSRHATGRVSTCGLVQAVQKQVHHVQEKASTNEQRII